MQSFNRHLLIDKLRGVGKQASVSEFARAIGYTDRQVTRWLSGESSPGARTIEKIAAYFSLPPDAFLTPPEMSQEEQQLLAAFRRLNRVDRSRVWILVDDLAKAAGLADATDLQTDSRGSEQLRLSGRAAGENPEGSEKPPPARDCAQDEEQDAELLQDEVRDAVLRHADREERTEDAG